MLPAGTSNFVEVSRTTKKVNQDWPKGMVWMHCQRVLGG